MQLIGTALTHLIGRPLIPLNFQQQRYEADFRFNLVRTRENSEQIAALHGEAAERERHANRFGLVVGNWLALMRRTKKLTFFTASYSQTAQIFPYLMAGPAYLAGATQLGDLMQTAWPSTGFRCAVVFRESVPGHRAIPGGGAAPGRLRGGDFCRPNVALEPPAIEVLPRADAGGIAIEKLNVRLPDSEPLIDAERLALSPGERVLGPGPSGAGKSTLFRAVAGIWPFGSGRVTVPEDAKILLLPQRPYFPVASLAAAVSYPAKAGAFDDTRIAEVIAAVGLPEWSSRPTRKRIGTACCRSASSSGSRSRAPSFRSPIICCSTRQRRHSMKPAEAALYARSTSGSSARPSSPSAIARRLVASPAAASMLTGCRRLNTFLTCLWLAEWKKMLAYTSPGRRSVQISVE